MHILMKEPNTHFKTVGWYENGNVAEKKQWLSKECGTKLAELIEKGPQYCWRGGPYGVANQYLYIDENKTRYDKAVATDFPPHIVELHANRFCLIRDQKQTVYVFPQSIMYWVTKGYHPPVDFCDAILHGNPVLNNELNYQPFDAKQDAYFFYDEWENCDNERRLINKDNILPPEVCVLPKQYQGDYKKDTFTVQSWINFGDSHEEGEYVDQAFYLPTPVDEHNLKAIMGRQSLQHLGMAHMAYGFGKIKEIAQTDKAMGEMLKKLFLDGDFLDEFEAYVTKQQGYRDMPERLKKLGPRYFPYKEHDDEH